MDVKLSSWHTVIAKFVFPPFWIGIFGYGTLMLWVQPEEVVFNGVKGAATPFHQVLFLLAFLGGTGFILWYAIPLKRVILTRGGLLISNYIREIQVPVDQVIQVRQSRNLRPPVLTLILRDPSEFGNEIRFMPSDDVPPNFLEEHAITKGFRASAGQSLGAANDSSST